MTRCFVIDGKVYGPFRVDSTGTPLYGDVVRYFRKLKGYSASYVASQLGGVTERWVLRMEHENKVPTSLTRRQAICTLLGIPPVLLGIITVTDDGVTPVARVKQLSIDIGIYNSSLAILWDSYRAGVSLSELLH